ncbi:TPA: hypothetical protein DD712_03045 [Candidatus Acetothermia bacterium]|nr:hypothetical protein [Candidatus Acetothermia bacterium]
MRTERKPIVAYVALLSSMFIWGFSFLVVKEVVATVPVFTLLFLRFFIATLFLAPFTAIKGELRLPRRDLLIVAGLTILGPIGYFLFETFGIANTLPSRAAVIIATIPTAVFLIALFLRQEKATWKKALGIIIAYLGVFLIIGLTRQTPGASLLGDLLILGAVGCAAIRTVLVKDILRRVTPLQLTFYQFFFSLALFGPLALSDGFNWVGQLNMSIIFGVLFLGVLSSAIAFFVMHYALAHLAATQVAVAANLIPVITLLAEVFLIGMDITLLKVLGVAITIIGVTLTQLAGRSSSRTDITKKS